MANVEREDPTTDVRPVLYSRAPLASHLHQTAGLRGNWVTRARTSIITAAVIAVALAFAGLLAPGTVGAQPEQGSEASIEIVQTPSGGGGFCLPAALAMRQSTSNDATTFRLRITITAPLCSRINAVAAIYSMPGNGVAWPQTLQQTKSFTLREPGVTEVIFTKGCDPVQFDVITGSTPQTIAPWGQWHGPLLFPFDPSTSYQYWGCGPPPTTTTTSSTSSTTTTTIDDNCEDYTPGDLAVSPASAAPGATLSVTGSGTPGTMVQVLLRPPTGGSNDDEEDDDGTAELVVAAGPAAASFVALSDPALVQPDGRWATTVIVPADAVSGTWTVAAQAVGCETEVTSEVVIDDGDDGDDDGGGNGEGGGTTTLQPPSTEGPVVAGEVVVAPLPGEALSASATTAQNGTGAPEAAGLAFTGTSSHVFVIAGVLMLSAGGLLLLSNRRRRTS